MDIQLDDLQQKAAFHDLSNGKILKGGTGSGKSRTAVAYFFTQVCGGHLRVNGVGDVEPLTHPRDLYIFTTAKKRDDLDWEKTCGMFALSKDPNRSYCGVRVTVDSWNNITKYTDVQDAFFIFDEQRLVGSGAWVKAFYKIAKANQWIVLTATPGDNWMDYCPIFVANGFYKNKTEFTRRHVQYSYRSKFPKIERYVEEGYLWKLRKKIIVDMPYRAVTTRHTRTIPVQHDTEAFQKVHKDRWHILEERPIRDISEMFALMRRIVNTSGSRTDALGSILEQHPRLIVFYNFDYELDLLRSWADERHLTYAEWNGHKHQPVPSSSGEWLYLVQYTAGAEAWECITTDAMVFFSLNYSYKVNEQAKGRIDRRNTSYQDLWYYVLRSNSWIDNHIWRAIAQKKDFNEKDYQFGD